MNVTRTDSRLPDLLTVTMIALVVYAASDVVHEAIGHGGACIAFGGAPRVLSTVHFDCGDDTLGTLARRGVAAAGTVANFVAAAFGLVAFRLIDPQRKPRAAYCLWLFTTVNLLSGAGYFLFSGVGNFGDWADVARGSLSPFLWRPTMAAFGGTVYFVVARQAAHRLRRLVGNDHLFMTRGRRLTVPAYVAGGLLFCVAGAFNPVGPTLIAVSAAAASFGGASGLLWLTEFLRRGEGSAKPAPLERSGIWIVAGCIVAVMFVGILGPSVHF